MTRALWYQAFFLAGLMLCGPSQIMRCVADVPEAVLRAETQRTEAIARAVRATISVFGQRGQDGGSGVVISPDGYALSNFHVTKPAGNYMKCSLPDGQLYDAVIVGLDPGGDVALIKLFGREDFPTTPLGDSSSVRVGDWCFAVGNPFLLATDFQPTVSYGLVSGVHRYQYPAGTLLEYTDCIQTDAAINPGNSGGPLFNAKAELIGINGRGSFEKRGRVNVGVGYAISINQIKNFLGYLKSGRIVDHATLGASVATDDDGRVLVTNILDSSDAYRRGLRYGDEIVRFGGRSIQSANDFKNVLGIFPKGWRVSLSYRRDSTRYDCFVRLPGVHTYGQLLKKVQDSPRPQMPSDPNHQPNGPAPRKDRPRPGIPVPVSERPQQAAMPEHISRIFEQKRGYANFYFNRLQRNRIWAAFAGQSDLAELNGTWKLNGELADGSSIQITLSPDAARLKHQDDTLQLDLAQKLHDQLDPVGSGGLLLALHQWHRMLSNGPVQFGEVYYLGTAPLPDRDELSDVLVGTRDVVESRWYFDPQTGNLLLLETFPDRDVDPCEIYFGDYQQVGEQRIPHHMEVRYGDRVYGVITINSVTLPEPPPKSIPKPSENAT